MVKRTLHRVLLCALLGMVLGSPGALAQGYPNRPVRMVVPFAPGGATDIIARVIAQKLSERLGQQVVIDNRAGAGGTVGTDIVAKSAPDGHTLLFALTPFVITQVMYPTLPYDAQRDFSPVALVAVSPQILVVNAGLPAKSLPELIALAKAKPGSLNMASAGNGTVTHLAAEQLKLQAGIEFVHVPYKGGGPATVALLAGEVSMQFAAPSEVIQYVQAGRLRVIATASARRLAMMPDVPTIREMGYPDFEAYSFFGILAPAGTSRDIIHRLANELATVMEFADVRERFAAQSVEPNVLPPEAFAAFLQAQRTKWGDVVKRSGAKID